MLKQRNLAVFRVNWQKLKIKLCTEFSTLIMNVKNTTIKHWSGIIIYVYMSMYSYVIYGAPIHIGIK